MSELASESKTQRKREAPREPAGWRPAERARAGGHIEGGR